MKLHDPETEIMYVGTMDVFLNRWHTTYDAAKADQEANGGYLFPYRHHFFVTEAPALSHLGLEASDPDWERIGRDWVRPLDVEAWERLRLKREIARI